MHFHVALGVLELLVPVARDEEQAIALTPCELHFAREDADAPEFAIHDDRSFVQQRENCTLQRNKEEAKLEREPDKDYKHTSQQASKMQPKSERPCMHAVPTGAAC